jgi:outer membrane protein assembly factor BamB
MAFDSSANFTYTGITDNFIKPLGVSSLYFIVTGAGGGGGWSGGNASGGGGAYAFTNYNYLNPNDTLSLSINVGSGGQPPPSQAGGKTIGAQNTPDGFYESNGGNGTTINSYQSGGGGGMTTVFDGSGTLIKIVAGGGGGGGNNTTATGGDSSEVGVSGGGEGGGQGGNTNFNGGAGLGGTNGGTNGYNYLDSIDPSNNNAYIFQGGGGGAGGTFAGGGGGAGYGGGAGGRQGGGGGGGSYSLPVSRTIFVAGGGGKGGTPNQAGQNGSVTILWNSTEPVLPHPFVEMFMLNAQHTSKSIYLAPTILPPVVNIYKSQSLTFPNSAVINSNNNIYIIAGDGRLYAFNADFSFRWSYTAPTNYKFVGTPALSNDLTLYIAATSTNNSSPNYLFAVIDNGSGNNLGAIIKWKFALSGNSSASPILDLNDIIYIGTDNGFLYAIKDGYNRGLPQWPAPFYYASPDQNAITGTPLFDISYNMICYTTTNTTSQISSIYALTIAPLNATLPTLTWFKTSPSLGEYYGTPSIDNGSIYVNTSIGKVYAYDMLGLLLWGPIQVNETNLSAMAIDTDYLYFTAKFSFIVLNRNTGALQWKYPVNIYTNLPPVVVEPVVLNNSIPTIDASQNIYFGTRYNYLYSLNAYTRTFNWKYKTGNSMVGMPVINNLGNLIVGSNDGNIYDLSGNGVPAPVTVPIVAMYMLNAQHTGLSPYTGPAAIPSLLWQSSFTCGNLYVLPTISIASNGTLYIGSDNGYLYIVNPVNGTFKTVFLRADEIYVTPLIAPDGSIYIGTNSGDFYALKPDGTIKWTFNFDSPFQSSPIMDASGTIYFGSAKTMLAIGDSGTEPYPKWLTFYQTGGVINSSPALGTNGYLYFGSDDGYVYSVDSFTGALIWKFNASVIPVEPIYSSPTVDASNNVLIGNGSITDGVLYYLDGLTGTVLWTYPSPPQTAPSIQSPIGPFYNAVAVKGNTVYLSTMTYIYAINRLTGIENWRFYKASCYYSSALVDALGRIFFTAIDARTSHGLLISLTDNGLTCKENWSYDTGAGRLATPVLGLDGTLYLSSTANKLYALR